MLSIEAFREDVWQAVWNHAKAIFKPLFILSIIYSLAILAIFTLGFSALFGPEFMELFKNGNPGTMEDMEALQVQILEYIKSIDPVRLIAGFITIYLLVMVISAWVFNVQLVVSEQKILTGKTRIGEAIQRSFSMNTVRILIVLIILFVAYLGIVILFGNLSGSLGMGFLALFVAAAVCVRLSGAISAVVHGSMSVIDALRFSWRSITWKRALYVIVVLIMATIVLFLLLLLLQAVFGFMGAAGDFLNTVSFLILNAFVLALTTAMFSAAFFRYADFDVVVEGEESTPDLLNGEDR